MLYVFVGDVFVLCSGFKLQTFRLDLFQNGLWKGSVQAEGNKIGSRITFEVRKIATMVYS